MAKAAFIPKMLAGQLVMVPMDDDGVQMVQACQGKQVMGLFKPARNVQHHRLMFALLNEVCESGAWEGDVESLLLWVKLRTRHVDVHEVDGKTITVPKSIKFESMSQAKFREFFDRAVFYLCRDLLCRDGWEGFRDEFLASVEGQVPDRRAA